MLVETVKRLVLVRRATTSANVAGAGATISGRTDVPLSDAGRRQVGLLAVRLAAGAPFDAIYSSPLARAADEHNDGVLVFGFHARYPAAVRELAGWTAAGKLKSPSTSSPASPLPRAVRKVSDGSGRSSGSTEPRAGGAPCGA